MTTGLNLELRKEGIQTWSLRHRDDGEAVVELGATGGALVGSDVWVVGLALDLAKAEPQGPEEAESEKDPP